MENVKFICSRITDRPNTVEYVFKLSEHIAYLIRGYSNYPKNILILELTEENEYLYRIESILKTEPDELEDNVIKTIERISNKYDEEGFWNNILTDKGKKRTPAIFHDLMINEYGVEDENVEWWGAHFFIGLSELVFSHEYDQYK